MGAAIRDLLPLVFLGPVRASLLVLLSVSHAFGLLFLPIVPWLLAVSLLGTAWKVRWAWRFARSTRRFTTLSGGRVVLRFSPELCRHCDPGDALALAERTLDGLEAVFGGPMRTGLARTRVRVFVFPTCRSVQSVFGVSFAGTALPVLHAVVVPLGVPLGEWLRHELAHLFVHRWNASGPPLLEEGLPTWLQGTESGHALDGLAAPLARAADWPLRRLLDRKFFFGERAAECYLLAGSFTGFLVSRFGWEAYGTFYRGQRGVRRFDERFKGSFGMSLEEAEGLWRAGLLGRHDDPR